METTGTMTVQEVLEKTITDLNEIQVPMAQLESIGLPLARGIMNIRMCVEAMKAAEAGKKDGEHEDA